MIPKGLSLFRRKQMIRERGMSTWKVSVEMLERPMLGIVPKTRRLNRRLGFMETGERGRPETS